MIRAESLTKRFGPATVVDGIDLDVPAGRVVGMLGPNGAGKTTTIRMLATLLRPDGGRASVAGHDVVAESHRVRRVVGLTGQYATVDEQISGWENLYLIGRLLDLPRRAARARADVMLERFSLVEAGRRRVGTYSGGMRRRLDLAASLLGTPAVLFLDEPTTGLDPRSRTELWDVVRRLVRDGTTVLLTTQYLEEADQLADSLVVLDGGRIVAEGPTAELRARVGGQVLDVRPEHGADLPRVAGLLDGAGLGGVPDGDVVRVPLAGPRQLTEVVALLGRSDVPLADVVTRTPSLDEVFLSLTGREAAR